VRRRLGALAGVLLVAFVSCFAYGVALRNARADRLDAVARTTYAFTTATVRRFR
jgi:hypothetical protein